MSGQLVGEVIAASDTLRARGVSERGFHALVAIAEKAAPDRTASVRWDHIRAGLYGASKRTAERAVSDLIDAGLIRVLRHGFKNRHGAKAPIYAVATLLDHDTQVSVSERVDHDTQVSVSERVDHDTQVSVSERVDHDTQVSVSERVDHDKSELDTDKTRGGYRHPGVVLDVSFDVSSDGEPRCARHRDPRRFPQPPPCPDCRTVRVEADAAAEYDAAEAAKRREAIRAAIDQCSDCDQVGRLDDLRDCPRHPNFRTVRTPA